MKLKLGCELKHIIKTLNWQRNLSPQEPQYLEKEANHLEVSKLCQNIKVGLRGAVPENVWIYMSPFLSPSLWSSLEGILEDILTESSIVNPLHYRCIVSLKEKRNNSSNSYFLIRLEEKINQIEFENITKESFLTHIYLENNDVERQKLTTEIHYTKQ